MRNGNDPLLEQIIGLKLQLRGLFLQHYRQYEVFTWIWWFGVACIVISLVIWWKVVDKKRLMEICAFGLIINVFSVFLDVIGSDYVLWEYPVRVVPQLSLLFPVDFVIVPVVFMIIYQKWGRWPKFLLASAIAGAALAFIVEPFAVWIGQYKLITWKLIYSFPIYIAIGAFAKILTDSLLRRQLKG